MLFEPQSAISFHVVQGSQKSKRPPGNVSPSSVESHWGGRKGGQPREDLNVCLVLSFNQFQQQHSELPENLSSGPSEPRKDLVQ